MSCLLRQFVISNMGWLAVLGSIPVAWEWMRVKKGSEWVLVTD